jgi:hypothetical protein
MLLWLKLDVHENSGEVKLYKLKGLPYQRRRGICKRYRRIMNIIKNGPAEPLLRRSAWLSYGPVKVN